MGEQVYCVGGKSIRFSETDYNFGCLCTFPWNDEACGEISTQRVMALALLGAAVKLIHDGYFADLDTVFIPESLPPWIVEQIGKFGPHEVLFAGDERKDNE